MLKMIHKTEVFVWTFWNSLQGISLQAKWQNEKLVSHQRTSMHFSPDVSHVILKRQTALFLFPSIAAA